MTVFLVIGAVIFLGIAYGLYSIFRGTGGQSQ